MKISDRHIVFQSFSSIGPMLDFIALLPIMALFAGSELPEATIMAFLISLVALAPVIGFSSSRLTNGGYADYVETGLGKFAGGFAGMVYIFYSILVLPNIIMFLASFLFSFYSIPAEFRILFDAVFTVSYLLLMFIPLSRGLSLTIKPIIALGVLEIGSMLLTCALLLSYSSVNGLPVSTGTNFSGGSFWEGVMIGILMFSGGGSGIFLSGESLERRASTPRSLFYAYITSGAALILASLSIAWFTGSQIGVYAGNPAFLLSRIGSIWSPVLVTVMIILLLSSGFNLTLSFGNALLQMMGTFLPEHLGMKKSRLTLSMIIVSVPIPILLVSRIYFSFFASFLFIAEMVSMLYVVVHVLVGFSYARKGKNPLYRIMGAISSVLLVIAISISIMSSGIPELYLGIIFAAILLIAFLNEFLVQISWYQSRKIISS